MYKDFMRSTERSLIGDNVSHLSDVAVPTNGTHKSDLIALLLLRHLQKKERERIIMLLVDNQLIFDELFSLIFHHERQLLVRAADAVENITAIHPEYLKPHKTQILLTFKSACPKELKWHMARLVSRIDLTDTEKTDVWHILSYWALNKNENKIIRINALRGLFDLSLHDLELQTKLMDIIASIEQELNPPIQASIRKLKRKLGV